jgi:hypothetical protein
MKDLQNLNALHLNVCIAQNPVMGYISNIHLLLTEFNILYTPTKL